VIAGGPAAEAGLRGSNNFASAGDIITNINDHDVQGIEDLIGYLIQHTAVGETVNLQVLRDGSTINIPLTLGARPSSG
jgi:S1-C subfamily serine protease